MKGTNKPQTLCWDCENACGGCSWSRPGMAAEPVKGWTATRNDIKNGSKAESYIVHACPEFVPDRRWDRLRRRA